MGLFTGKAATAPRPSSSTPLKRRSLGGSKKNVSSSAPRPAAAAVASAPTEPPPKVGAVPLRSAAGSKLSADEIWTASVPDERRTAQSNQATDEDQDIELEDLQSDNAFLYHRIYELDEALGLSPPHLPGPSLLEQIDEYICKHYLDCFGITHKDELIRHHNRLVPFFAKAPRFLSVHSLKRKELDQDFTDVPDTTETCARKLLCQGRCLLGFSCPTQDLPSSNQEAVT